jgi:flagellar biosynthetic protein FliQ
MTEGDVLDLVQSALWTTLVVAGPVVGASMAVGVAIALLQALTQVQEMTLTFVPKLVVAFAVFSLTASFIGSEFQIFTQSVYSHIEHGYRE